MFRLSVKTTFGRTGEGTTWRMSKQRGEKSAFGRSKSRGESKGANIIVRSFDGHGISRPRFTLTAAALPQGEGFRSVFKVPLPQGGGFRVRVLTAHRVPTSLDVSGDLRSHHRADPRRDPRRSRHRRADPRRDHPHDHRRWADDDHDHALLRLSSPPRLPDG